MYIRKYEADVRQKLTQCQKR